MKKVFILGVLVIILGMTLSRSDFASETDMTKEDSSIEAILVHSFSMLNNVPIGQGMGDYNQPAVEAYRQAVETYITLRDGNASGESMLQAETDLRLAYKDFLSSRNALQADLDAYNRKLADASALLEREKAGRGVFFTPEAYYALEAGLNDLKPYQAGEILTMQSLQDNERTIDRATEAYLTPRTQPRVKEVTTETLNLIEQMGEANGSDERVNLFQESIVAIGDQYDDLQNTDSSSKELLNEIIRLANVTIADSGRVDLGTDQIQVEGNQVTVKPAVDDVREAIKAVEAVEKAVEDLTRKHVEDGVETAILRTVTIAIADAGTDTDTDTSTDRETATINLSNEVVDLLKSSNIDQVRLDLGAVSFELTGDFLNQEGTEDLDFSAEKQAPLASSANVKEGSETSTLNLPVYDLTTSSADKEKEAFQYPLALTFDLSDVEAVGEDELYVVHRYNEETKLWEPVYGFYDPILKRMVVRRGHLSKYTVLKSKTSLSQLEDTWAKEEIAALVGSGVIDSQSLIDPKSNISREEFSNWIVKAYGLEAETIKQGFDDISEDSPYYESITVAYELGIVTGYEDGTFKPDADITRDELAMMIGSAIEAYNDTVDTDAFELSKYEEDLPEWAVDSIETVVENGLTTEAYFVVDGSVTLEEAASILYNVNDIYR